MCSPMASLLHNFLAGGLFSRLHVHQRAFWEERCLGTSHKTWVTL